MRDADGAWRWQYLAHEDNAWRNVRVSFSGDAVSVYRKGHPVRSLPLQAGDVNRAAMREGDDYLPAAYAADDVLKWHNAKFKF